jgi:isopentenyl phosphate kinase
LGGSLLTDKTREATLRSEHLGRLVAEVKGALAVDPETRLLIGHGSGSFGHFAGRRFGTRDGVKSRSDWVGYAQVSAAAARLNRFVVDAFLDAGVPVLNLQPSASALCQDGQLQSLALDPIRTALDNGLIPILHGDVALDSIRGGTILSTEEILIFLAPILRPTHILLAGEVAGVLDQDGRVIPRIRTVDFDPSTSHLGGSHGVDVTGGMFSKVHAMLDLVTRYPDISVRIFSGLEANAVRDTILDRATPGTELTA